MGRPVCLLSNWRISSTEWKSSSAWRGVILTSSSFGGAGFCSGCLAGDCWALAVLSCVARLGGACAGADGAHTAIVSTTAEMSQSTCRKSPFTRLIEIESIRFSILSLVTAGKPVNLWTSSEHVRDYLERADSINHRE